MVFECGKFNCETRRVNAHVIEVRRQSSVPIWWVISLRLKGRLAKSTSHYCISKTAQRLRNLILAVSLPAVNTRSTSEYIFRSGAAKLFAIAYDS